jgi:hypothetical protein
MPGPFFVGLDNGNVVFFFNQVPRQLKAHQPGPDDNSTHHFKYNTVRALVK